MESTSSLPYIRNSSFNESNSKNKIIQTSICKNKMNFQKKRMPINFKKRLFHNLSTTSLIKNLSHYRIKFLNEISHDIKDKEMNNNNLNDIKEKSLMGKNESENSKVDNNINANLGNNIIVQNFLLQKISKNNGFKSLKRNINPETVNKKEKKHKLYGNNCRIFKVIKNIVFEKEIFHLSLYDNFDNYKPEKHDINHLVKIQDNLGKNNSRNTGTFGFHSLKKIGSLDKVLLKKGERDTNGNSIYSNHEQEKEETIVNDINNDKSKRLIKSRLTKIKGNENMDKENGRNKDFQNEDTKYLKRIILRNRIKNRSQDDLNTFDTYDQKNKKILSIICENYKNNNRNKSVNEDLKSINFKNNIFFKKRRMNEFSNKINSVENKLNNVNKKLDRYLYKIKSNYDREVDKMFEQK